MKLQLQIGIPSSSSIGNINISDLPACDLASAQHVKVIRKNVDARCSIKLFRYIYILCALTVCKSKSFRKWELNIYIVWEAVWVNPHSAQFDFCSQSAFISKSDFAIWLGLVAEETLITSSPSKPFISRLKSFSLGQGWRQRPPSTTPGPQWRGGAADLGPFLYLHAALQPPLAALIQLQSWVHFYICMTHRTPAYQYKICSQTLKIKLNKLVVTKMPPKCINVSCGG